MATRRPERIHVFAGDPARAHALRLIYSVGLAGAVALAGLAFLLAFGPPGQELGLFFIPIGVLFAVVATALVIMGARGQIRAPGELVATAEDGGIVVRPFSDAGLIVEGIAYVCMMATALVWTNPVAVAATMTSRRMLLVHATYLVGAFLFAKLVWSTRNPRGLRVDARGLSGVRGGPRIDVAWSDLVHVHASVQRRRPNPPLVLSIGNRVVRISPLTLGGDAVAIATVIDYYRTHPGQRFRFDHGLDAIHHVAAEIREGRIRTPVQGAAARE